MNRTINLSFAIGTMCVLAGTLLTSCNQKKEEERPPFRPFGRDTAYVENGVKVEVWNDGSYSYKEKTTIDSLKIDGVKISLEKKEVRQKYPDGKGDTSYVHEWAAIGVTFENKWSAWPASGDDENLRIHDGRGDLYYTIKGDTVSLSGSILKGYEGEIKPSMREKHSEAVWGMYDEATPVVKKMIRSLKKASETEGISISEWRLN